MNKPLPPLPDKGLSLWDLPAWLAAHGLRPAGRPPERPAFRWEWADVVGRGRVKVLVMEVESLDIPPRV